VGRTSERGFKKGSKVRGAVKSVSPLSKMVDQRENDGRCRAGRGESEQCGEIAEGIKPVKDLGMRDASAGGEGLYIAPSK